MPVRSWFFVVQSDSEHAKLGTTNREHETHSLHRPPVARLLQAAHDASPLPEVPAESVRRALNDLLVQIRLKGLAAG